MRAVHRTYSLRWRLSCWFAGQTFIGLGALGLAIYAVAAWSLANKADATLARKRDLVVHLVKEASAGGDVAMMRHKLDDFFVAHEDMEVTLLGTAGSVLYRSAANVGQEVLRREINFRLPEGVPTAPVARARIALDRSEDARLLTALAGLLALVTVLGTVAISLSGFWLVRRSLEPLHGLADEIRALRIDRLGQRLQLDPAVEELQPWIEQFNELLGRVDYAYRQLEGFNADVAHELRTPLATLIGQTEVLLSRERAAEEMRDTLGSNLEELRRLSSIVNDMLFLARADRGVRASAAPRADLVPVMEQVIEFHEAALAEKALTAHIAGRASACFEPGLIRRAVSNLLANAVRYADMGTPLVVTLRQEGAATWIEVSNRGPEVPESLLLNLFDRFFRLEAARGGSSENHGLGLAIVAAIARMHGGSTTARCSSGETTVGFSISGVPPEPPFAGESPLGASRS